MPLTLKTVSGVVSLTWTSPDQSTEASFKIRPKMSEEEILSTLEKALRFIRAQMSSDQQEMLDLEREIPSTGGPTTTPSSPSPTGETILMAPATDSRPSDGGPPISTFGWGDMPTTTVPSHLQTAWEIIPPGEA